MLPLSILSAAQGGPMLVELKNGETLNGHLVQCDTWMNLTLKEVVWTNADADRFMRLSEIYVKGNNVPEEVIDKVKEQQQQQQQQGQQGQQGQYHGGYQSNYRGGRGAGYQRGSGDRGDRGGRGGGRGRGRGRGQ